MDSLELSRLGVGVEGVLPPISSPARWAGVALADVELGCTPERPAEIGFELRGVLGEGAMGVVHRAVQEYPRRTVALKVLKGTVAEAEAFRRFKREVELLARVQHPGVPHLYSAGVLEMGGGRVPFIAMELVEGVDIEAYCTREGLSVMGRVELMLKVCDAVEAVHAAGIVHRDLSVRNILVDGAGRVKVLDFGLGALVEGTPPETLMTAAGRAFGTFHFMSPEQAGGKRGEVGQRSDVYALGAILYRVLSGKYPIELEGCDVVESVRRIQTAEPIDLGKVDRALRGDLALIVAKALAKDPADRYGSVRNLGEELQRFLAHEPIQARPASAWDASRKFVRRHRVLVGAAGAVFAALLAGLIATSYEAVKADGARKEARLQFADAQVADGMASYELKEYDAGRDALNAAWDAYEQEGVDPASARMGIWMIDHASARFVRTLTVDPAAVKVAVSPEGRFVAVKDRDGTITLREVATGKVRWRMKSELGEMPVMIRQSLRVPPWGPEERRRSLLARMGEAEELRFSPKGRYLLVKMMAGCEVWDVEKGKLVCRIPFEGPALPKLAISEEQLCIVEGSRWRSVPLAAPAHVEDFGIPAISLREVGFAGDGALLMLTYNGEVLKRGADGVVKEAGQVIVGMMQSGERAVVSPGGGYLMFTTPEETRIFAAPDYKQVGRILGYGEAEFCTDGVLCASDPASGQRELFDVRGQALRPLPEGNFSSVAFGGDLFAGMREGGRVDVYSIRRAMGVESWDVQARPVAADLSGNGELAGTVGADGRATVWDAASGRALKVMDVGPLAQRTACAMSMGADGREMTVLDGTGKLLVINTATGKVERSAEAGVPLGFMAVSRSGEVALATERWKAGAFVWRRKGNGWERAHVDMPGQPLGLVLSPAGDRVVVMQRGNVEVWDLRGVPRQVDGWATDPRGETVRWDETGERLYTMTAEGTVQVRKAGRPGATPLGQVAGIREDMAPIGSHFLAATSSDGVTIFDVDHHRKAGVVAGLVGNLSSSDEGDRILVWNGTGKISVMELDQPGRLRKRPQSVAEWVGWLETAKLPGVCAGMLDRPSKELTSTNEWAVGEAFWSAGKVDLARRILERTNEVSETTKTLIAQAMEAGRAATQAER